MAMEVVCGNCQGRLLVEHTGVVVACPHCGAHLQIGDPAPPAVQVPAPSYSPPVPQFAPPQPEAPATFISQAPPPIQFAPPEYVPPPAPVAPPPVSPFPISFEPPAAAAFQPAAQPEPLFPEIILTPPAAPPPPPAAPEVPAPSIPVIASGPEPVAAPNWNPQPQIGLPSEPAASDSWMPQINLALPPPVVETPPPVPPPALPAPPLAEPETATTLTPAMPFIDASPSTVNLSPTPSGAPANQTDIWNPTRVENPRAEETVISFPGAEPSFANFGNFNAAPTVAVNVAPAAAPSVTPSVAPTFTPTPASPPPAAPTQTAGPAIVTSTARRDATVPRVLFVMVASYASAMTLAFLYLWARPSTSTLDLPDVRPKIKNGQFGLSLVPEDPLPAAWRLKLGESKRYGNLMVTPLKVTKGPLEFVHFGDEKQTKTASQTPVLKLWVKFENVSSNQTFPALDERLLFQRAPDRDNPLQDRSNNYVCLQSECKREGKRIPVYTFPIGGEWLLKGQELDTPLKPSEEWETYIPTNDEDLSDLRGPLCWRVHFRKGYNPQSMWGVTTVVEVEFDSKDIQADS
ncbi:MAG: hypothetical protein JWN70_6434 [Planctomycetaceae bacterium]|nr:hypothetical protein [Planctomycetaceae bacterium]